MDPIARFKEMAKVGWSGFAPTAVFTGAVAPRLVKFAQLPPGAAVLDVGCGTGVVSLVAARHGARVTGVDLTPALIERAQENSAIAGLAVDWQVGDAEQLPFADSSFDAVLSQFGHLFAPRPALAVAEMLRVLKPGGRIAFSTWPPDLFVGKLFTLTSKFGPPAPADVPPPELWGDPAIVRERLGSAVRDLTFDYDLMRFPCLSVPHQRLFFEANIGPVQAALKHLASDPAALSTFRDELERLMDPYFEDNVLRQDYLLTRAIKK